MVQCNIVRTSKCNIMETSKRNIMGASKYNNRATILSGPKCSLELVKWKSVGPCLLWVRPSDIETPT